MLRSLLSFLILSTFICGFVSEAIEGISFDLEEKNERNLEKDSLKANVILSENIPCDDCQKDWCGLEDSCCLLQCPCHLFGLPRVRKINFKGLPGKESKIVSFYYHKYIPPFLDPALKPPLFS